MSTKTKWIIDPVHSEIAFTVKHLMISNIQGAFKKYDASIYTDGDDFNSADIDFWLDPSSLDTGNEDRDHHLRSPDFFDTKNHQQITFTGILETTESKNKFELCGDLTIKDNTKRVKFDVEFGGLIKDPSGNIKAGFTIHGTINRKDLGLVWNAPLAGGGVMLSEHVKINCNVELQKVTNEVLKKQEEMSIEDEPIPAVI